MAWFNIKEKFKTYAKIQAAILFFAIAVLGMLAVGEKDTMAATYKLTLNGRTYEVEVELAKPMMMPL